MPAFGHYSLEDLLSSSPDATVWRGTCRRPIERSVAVKQLRARDPGEAARVLEEVRALVALDHPHVVRVLDVIDHEDGVVVVMQYAPGGSLAQLLSSRPSLDAGETVAVAAPLADALASAHRQGIVHGDLKPSNVLFTSDGEPLLADFGGTQRGTDGYIAPEVLAGGAPGARSDVFGLGVVCREALGGDVPPELAPVLDAAVAIDPDQRPASASELARLLRAAVPTSAVRLPRHATAVGPATDTPTRVFGPRPPSVPDRRAPRWRRAAVVAPLIVAAAAATVLFSSRTTHHDLAGRATQVAAVPCAGNALAIPPNSQVVRGDTSGLGCVSTGVYANQVLTIRVRPTDATPRRFALGLPGDRLYLDDWNCDGVATPALFRPSTGSTLYYESWSASATPSNDTNRCRSIA